MSLSYRNQSIDLLRKSMDWLIYDSDLRHEKVNKSKVYQKEISKRSQYFIFHKHKLSTLTLCRFSIHRNDIEKVHWNGVEFPLFKFTKKVYRNGVDFLPIEITSNKALWIKAEFSPIEITSKNLRKRRENFSIFSFWHKPQHWFGIDSKLLHPFGTQLFIVPPVVTKAPKSSQTSFEKFRKNDFQ